MRILQLNNSEAIVGGSDRVYHETCRLLHEHGHQVTSISCGTEPDSRHKRSYLLSKNAYHGDTVVGTIRNALDFIYRRDAAELVERVVREARPEVAHLHIFYGQLSTAVLRVLRRERIPTVMTVHEYRMLCPVSTMFRPSEGICDKCGGGNYHNAVLFKCNRGNYVDSALSALECWTRDRIANYVDSIDHFIMVSEFCRRLHVKRWPIIGDRTSTVYNFVQVRFPGAASQPPMEEPPGSYLLYAGRLSPEKGVAELLGAVAGLTEIRLVVAGTGVLADTLKGRFGDHANIRFAGHLDQDELAKVIAKARWCIVPSIWYENSPMSVLESFAAGVPVVASSLGGLPELVVEGKTGILFDPYDTSSMIAAIRRAWVMPETERRQFSARCLEHVRAKHSPDGYLRALVNIYHSVAGMT